MFDNIGGKIKTVASTLTVIGIVLSIFSGLIVLLDGSAEGLLLMIFGSLFSWLGSFLLYGFGQLIENSDKLVALLDSSSPKIAAGVTPRYSSDYRPMSGADHHPSIDEPVYPPATPADWVCFACGNTNFYKVKTCQVCGVTKHWSDEKHAEAASSIGFK